MKLAYNKQPQQTIRGTNRDIGIFSTEGNNIAADVVESFGEEWLKFNEFSDEVIEQAGNEYFDILNESIINKNCYVLDIGCGTGRWTKFLTSKVGFIEAVDPSNSIFVADKLLGNIENVRLTKASTETLPFDDESFDFVMSVGVLHHIPDTLQAMKDCVKKVKKGGYFYCYLYHNLETRGIWFRSLFLLSELIRKIVCQFPNPIKRFVCDLLAIFVYMPFVLIGKFIKLIGFKKLALKIPLSGYQNKTFFVVRNDSLDKFGTRLEFRFSKKQVEDMMNKCGLENVVISPSSPHYHSVGRKK